MLIPQSNVSSLTLERTFFRLDAILCEQKNQKNHYFAKVSVIRICSTSKITLMYVSFFQKVDHSRPLFIYFRLFNTVDNKQMFNKILPMTGVEPWTSGIESNRSTN